MHISEWLTPAVVSLITLAVALPIQKKSSDSKALETLEKVYGKIIEKLDGRVEKLEALLKIKDSKHCGNADTCKNRVE